MVWKDYACKACGKVQENVPSKIEDTERECPECGEQAQMILYPHFTRFKGGGWTTRRPVEAFPGESEYVEDWGKESHGVEASLRKQKELEDADW